MNMPDPQLMTNAWMAQLNESNHWKSWLQIVQPASVVRWHRKFAALLHRMKSRPKKRKARTKQEIRDLVRRIHREKVERPGWGRVPLCELLEASTAG